MTCTDHETRSKDESSPYWRASHDMALVEMTIRSDDGQVLDTIWDHGHCWAGGQYGCDGSDDGPKLIPVPGERLPWLN